MRGCAWGMVLFGVEKLGIDRTVSYGKKPSVRFDDRDPQRSPSTAAVAGLGAEDILASVCNLINESYFKR